jgi:ketosteroid isomerase-like protein
MTDQDEMRNMLARYASAHDDFNTQELIDMHAEDAVFYTSTGELRGHAALREFHDGRKARSTPDVTAKLVVCDPLINVDGDHANAATYVVGLRREGTDPWTVSFIAQWADRFRHDKDGWRYIEKRVLY